MVDRRKLGDRSLNCIFNAVLIGLQNALLFERPDLGLKCLVTVMPKGQLPTVKVSVCSITISQINSNCNSILKPGDSNGVTMELRGKVE